MWKLWHHVLVLILAKTASGRSAGSFGWSGVANTYYFIDPVKGIGAIFGSQLFPWCDSMFIESRDEFEGLVYQTLCLE